MSKSKTDKSDFSFLKKDEKVVNENMPTQEEEYVVMTQAEVEKNVSNKKEMYEFFQTQNVFLYHFDKTNTDFLSGIMSDDVK